MIGFTFQLTASQGGRPLEAVVFALWQIFQLTASQGGRPIDWGGDRSRIVFQLTASQGGRPDVHQETIVGRITFNSRPHKEADLLRRSWFCCKSLSTHGLTRRPTKRRARRHDRLYLSTHGLTRRPTDVHQETIVGRILSTHGLTRRPTRCFQRVR